MKRAFRILALLLVLVTALCVTASAATLHHVIPNQQTYQDCRILTFSADGVVPFTTGYVDGGTTAACVFEGIEKLKLTFTPQSVTDDFVAFLLKASEEETVSELVPTSTNLAYIDQEAGAASHEFVIYPSALEDGATYGIYVSSQTDGYQYMGSLSVASSVTMVTWRLGDVTGDGYIDSQDALWALKFFAGTLGKTPTAEEKLAADVNFDGYVDTRDSIKMLQLFAGKISSFY